MAQWVSAHRWVLTGICKYSKKMYQKDHIAKTSAGNHLNKKFGSKGFGRLKMIKKRYSGALPALLGMIGLMSILLSGCEPQGTNIQNVSYKNGVQPIFDRSCVECHNQALANGGIQLQDYQNLMSSISMNTGDPIVVVGDAYKSVLYDVISTDDFNRRMPRNRPPLAQETADSVGVWINEGALDN
jgi:hypothetical protein